MRFSELHLIRYGQFDGCRLSFPHTPSDLHVVFGPNEAGKSTTMAAVADLLFGFPHAAAYDFLFDKTLLRVGGIIEGGEAPLACRRRRGNARTLLDAAEQPIDEGPLAALLAGQTRESFLRAFSLDHARLRDGGRAMLEAKDDVGQAIFAAGSGLVGVTRLVEALDEEAKAIWSENASARRSYYVAQKAHDEAKSRLRETQLKSAHWSELKKALDGHERDLQELRRQRETLQASVQQIERRRRILVPMARRAHLLDQLGSFGALPDLPADAGTVVEIASRQLAESETTVRLARDQAAVARKQLEGLTYDSALLNRRGQVTQLRAQQGAVDKALRDTPGLKTKAATASEQLLRLLREVGWPSEATGDVQRRLPGRPQVNDARALLEEHRGLESNRDTSIEDVDEQSRLTAELRTQLEDLESTETHPAFEAVLADVRAQGDVEAAAAAARTRHEKARRALELAIGGLAPWRGAAEELAVLPAPSEAETDQLSASLVAAQEEKASADRALIELRNGRDQRDLRRAQLLRDEHAVSSDMLQAAREARDATWGKLSDHLTGTFQLETPGAAQEQFSQQLRAADDVADRRFDGATTSAALLALDHELERLELEAQHAKRRCDTAESALDAAQKAWSAATGVVGGTITPGGLKAWRANRLRALELAEAERGESEEVERLVQAIELTRDQLLRVLPKGQAEALAGSPLAILLQATANLETAARQQRDQAVALQGRINAAEAARQRAEARRDEANRRLEAWRGRWVAAVTAAGLDAQGSLPLIRARLDLMDELRSLCETILGHEQRIRDIGADVEAFTAQVHALAAEFGLETDAEPAMALALLEQQLATIATLAERADGLRTQLKNAEARETEANEAMQLARATLSPLLAAAGVDDLTDLRRVISQVEEANQLNTEVEEITRSVIELGDGLGLADLIGETADSDAAELAAESDRQNDELRTLSDEIERVAELRQAAYLQFKQADDRPDAAIAAADIAQARAEMEAQAEAYVRKRAEAALLRWTVERYRREKQAPLLKRASAIFSELTLGRYTALGIDVEDGHPRLSGICADAATVVPVAGMSDGTVDQLFLAIRLAAVEESVAAGVRLPFLADDLFINYDDARSAAGFRVLAKLAEQTQVLFFTHHEHLADLARDTLTPSNVSTCRLGELRMEAA